MIRILIFLFFHLADDFTFSTLKLEKQFYTDVEQFTSALNKIFEPMKKSKEFKT